MGLNRGKQYMEFWNDVEISRIIRGILHNVHSNISFYEIKMGYCTDKLHIFHDYFQNLENYITMFLCILHVHTDQGQTVKRIHPNNYPDGQQKSEIFQRSISMERSHQSVLVSHEFYEATEPQPCGLELRSIWQNM